MRNLVMSILMKFPWLYGWVRASYWQILEWRARMLGTFATEQRWKKYWDECWIQELKENRLNHHRKLLLDCCVRCSPMQNALEIGCNCGSNLLQMARHFPNMELKGVDINPVAILRGNAFMASQGLRNVKLLNGQADDLFCFQNASIDFVFTDAVLMYIGPDKIRRVLSEMLRVCRKTIVMLEWHRYISPADEPVYFWRGYWIKDYLRLFGELVAEDNITCTKIPGDIWLSEGWKTFGYLIKVTVPGS